MRVVGIDPSLSNFGICTGLIADGTFVPDALQLIESKADKKTAKVVRKNSDDLNRARTLFQGMYKALEGADLAIAEVPVGSQSSRAMASYGICIGVLASIDIPLIQVTPAEVKLIATNSKTASKSDMIDWATNLNPQLPWLTRTVKGETSYVSKNEHLADALATVYAGMNTDIFKTFMAFSRKSA